MLKSDLCWMKGVEKDNCDFDHGGYFLIKGAEKVRNLYLSFQYIACKSILQFVALFYFFPGAWLGNKGLSS